MPKYPWAVRAGGPLLGGGGGLPTIFDWNPEIAQALPATSTFTRASIAQVLTTTDGTTNWYQEAKSGEVRLDGLRRVENDFTADLLSGWSPLNGATQPDDGTLVFPGLASDERSFTQLSGYDIGQTVGYRVRLYVDSGTALIRIRTTGGTSVAKDITVTTDPTTFWISGNVTAAANVAFFIDNAAAGGPTTATLNILETMTCLIQPGTSLPEDFAQATVTYNADVAGVRYFNTTNGNSVDGSGVVTEAAGTTITGGGYLPEPAATNRLLHSNDMTQAAWVAQGAVVPTDLGVTDIGGQSTQIAGLGTLGVDDIAQSVGGFTASGAVAPSVLLRRNSTTGTLRISSVGGLGNGEWQVDLSLIGPGWVRLEPGATVPGFSEFTPWVADGAGNAGVVYSAVAGGPLTVDLSFNKTENTAFATSPIVTAASIQTRVADSLTDVDWPATAAAVIDTTVNSIVPGGTIDNQQNMLGFGDNTAYAFGISAPSTARIFTGGINSFIVAASSYEGERHGFGMSFQVNEGIVVDDEDNDNTDVTGTPGGGTIQIGLNSGLVGVPGRYHRARIAPVTQTVDELKALV